MFRVGVDGKAKENELDHRDPDHHAERETVTTHLDEFFDHHGPTPRE